MVIWIVAFIAVFAAWSALMSRAYLERMAELGRHDAENVAELARQVGDIDERLSRIEDRL